MASLPKNIKIYKKVLAYLKFCKNNIKYLKIYLRIACLPQKVRKIII